MRWCPPAQVLVLLGLLAAAPAAAQEVALRGFVTDRSDGKPLQGAHIVLEDTLRQIYGAAADRDGYYRVVGARPGRYVVRVSFVGYVPFVDTLLLDDPLRTLNVALRPDEGVLDEVVVAAEGGAARVRAGQQTIRPADLQRIPTPGVGGDLAAYLQSLPGVVSLGDRGGQLFIRGGTPSQNLVLVDGILVYQPLHILGFFSAFPEDLVASVDLYAGGFGARYSGRISSVVDVTMQEGSKEAFGASVSASPFLAGLRLEGPLRKGSVSMLGSVRRSLIERLGPALYGEPMPFHFGDAFLKVHAGRGSSRCSVMGLHTYDQGRIGPDREEGDDVFRWRNTAVGGRCLVLPAASPILLDLSTGISYVENAVGEAADPERVSDALQVASEVNLSSFLGRHRFNWGFFARAGWMGYRLGDLFLNVRTGDDVLLSAGGYADAEVALGDRLRIIPGLAFVLHPFTYPLSLEPRLRLSWQPQGEDGPQEFSAAFGLYRQAVVGASDERDGGSAFLAWMPIPDGSVPARAVHVLAGWQQQLGPSLRLAAEAYYKQLRDLAVPAWSMVASFTTRLVAADGDVLGFDTRIEFRRRPFYAYLGYGLSQTEYFVTQGNFGVWFGEPVQRYYPPHDRRHQVNAVLSLALGGFDAHVRWQFGSGLPYTRPLGFDEWIPLGRLPDVRTTYGTTRVLYEKPYRGRLPTYHRLDVSVERAFPLGAARLTAQVGAVNLYDRANLFYYDVFTVQRVDQLPLLPYLALKLETR